MPESDDISLLRQYAESSSESAFATLVERHVDLVYSVALRSIGNRQAAEDVTQAVFIILARKAQSLSNRTVLSGWLFQTTRLTVGNFLRGEIRRQKREQEAFMQSTLNNVESEAWPQIAPMLDEAVSRLGKRDRDAVVLRFFENRTFAEVGAALGASEDAAKMRVSRALETLRKFFLRRGVHSTTAAIAHEISANSIQAAPLALAKTISTVALTKGATAGASTVTLVKGALKIMAWTKAQTVIVAGVCLLAAAATTTAVVKAGEAKRIENLWRVNKDVSGAQIDKLPPLFKVLPTKFGPPWVDWNSNKAGNKFVGARAQANIIAAFAYGFPLGRVHFANGIPPERFDFVATLPHGSRTALREWLKTKLGLVGHRETNDMQVLLLRVKHPNARGLKPPILGRFDEYEKSGVFHSSDEVIDSGPPLYAGLAEYLERYFKMPVIDETGLKQHFSIDLRWKETKGHPNPEGLKQILGSWLGLELVPARRPVVTLMMEHQSN